MKKNDTIDQVIGNGLCIGCGSCAFLAQGEMRETAYGFYTPNLPISAVDSPEVARICPFSNLAKNEDQISSDIFDDDILNDPFIGAYHGLYAGHSNLTASTYGEATSGGMITWILHALLESRVVNYVVHAKETPDTEDFEFNFGITDLENQQQLIQKSKYFPTEMSEVLKTVESELGSVAFVGLPCQVKAIRLLQNHNPVLKARIKICIGLVCGHLKSKHYARYLAEECSGEMVPRLKSIDFRHREAGADMADYSVKVATDNGKFQKRMKQVFASGWQYNLFRNSACDYCDDVFAETADVSVGDIWLDRYRQMEPPYSLVVVRSKRILRLLRDGEKRDEVRLDRITPGDAVRAQAGGLRDRRDYLSVRLSSSFRKRDFDVKKRVQPSQDLNVELHEKINLRMDIASISHEAWLRAVKQDDINLFKSSIEPIKKRLDSLDGGNRSRIRVLIRKTLPRALFLKLFSVYSKISYFRRIWFRR